MDRFFLIIIFLSLFISVPARADEEAVRMIGGVALGLLGLALDKSENAQTEEPAKKMNKVSSPSKPKLQYSQDVADVQKKLKMIGYYDGVVDGLKGQNTSTSINRWEKIYSSQADDGVVDAMLSDGEVKILNKLVDNLDDVLGNEESVVADTVDNDRPKKISEMKGVKAQTDLYPAFKNYIAYKDSGQNCLAYKQQAHPFKKFNGQYRQFVDKDFQENFKNITRQDLERLRNKAKCNDMTDTSFDALMSRAQNEYDSSPLGVAIKSGLLMVMRDPKSEEKFVDGCNDYSYNVKKHYTNQATETLNDKTCKFE